MSAVRGRRHNKYILPKLKKICAGGTIGGTDWSGYVLFFGGIYKLGGAKINDKFFCAIIYFYAFLGAYGN